MIFTQLRSVREKEKKKNIQVIFTQPLQAHLSLLQKLLSGEAGLPASTVHMSLPLTVKACWYSPRLFLSFFWLGMSGGDFNLYGQRLLQKKLQVVTC